jgi:hypothetical protein
MAYQTFKYRISAGGTVYETAAPDYNLAIVGIRAQNNKAFEVYSNLQMRNILEVYDDGDWHYVL